MADLTTTRRRDASAMTTVSPSPLDVLADGQAAAEAMSSGEQLAPVTEARQKMRHATRLVAASKAPTTALPTAAQLLRAAADLLDEEFEQRALATARGEADYDPDAILYDILGRQRKGASMPGYWAGREPANKGKKYEPDPPTLDDILALLNACEETPLGWRMYALILVLWRTGLRIGEALALRETALYPERGVISVREGKGGKSAEIGMDDWVWPLLQPWMHYRRTLAPGPLFCVVQGLTTGIAEWNAHQVRYCMRRLGLKAGVRRRVAPHQFRHALSVELMIEGKSMIVLQRQLRHANLQVTTIYTRSLPQQHVIDQIRSREMPTVPAFAGGMRKALAP